MIHQPVLNQTLTQVFVGSTNPVKVSAVQQAIISVWPEVKVIGISVESGVPNQPKTDLETQLGADQRATAVLAAGLSQFPLLSRKHLALGIGLEGGVFQPNLASSQLWSTVWISLISSASTEIFRANGARFKIPDQIATGILAGQEMGDVVGGLAQNPNLKREGGMIGLITAGFVDRTIEYTALTKLAVGLWFGRDWHINISQKS